MRFLEDREFVFYMEKESRVVDVMERLLEDCEERGLRVVDVLRDLGVGAKRFMNDPTEEDVKKVEGYLRRITVTV